MATRASCLAPLPFAPAGQADETGIATTHNIIATAGWSEDAQVRMHAGMQLRVGHMLCG